MDYVLRKVALTIVLCVLIAAGRAQNLDAATGATGIVGSQWGPSQQTQNTDTSVAATLGQQAASGAGSLPALPLAHTGASGPGDALPLPDLGNPSPTGSASTGAGVQNQSLSVAAGPDATGAATPLPATAPPCPTKPVKGPLYGILSKMSKMAGIVANQHADIANKSAQAQMQLSMAQEAVSRAAAAKAAADASAAKAAEIGTRSEARKAAAAKASTQLVTLISDHNNAQKQVTSLRTSLAADRAAVAKEQASLAALREHMTKVLKSVQTRAGDLRVSSMDSAAAKKAAEAAAADAKKVQKTVDYNRNLLAAKQASLAQLRAKLLLREQAIASAESESTARQNAITKAHLEAQKKFQDAHAATLKAAASMLAAEKRHTAVDLKLAALAKREAAVAVQEQRVAEAAKASVGDFPLAEKVANDVETSVTGGATGSATGAATGAALANVTAAAAKKSVVGPV